MADNQKDIAKKRLRTTLSRFFNFHQKKYNIFYSLGNPFPKPLVMGEINLKLTD